MTFTTLASLCSCMCGFELYMARDWVFKTGASCSKLKMSLVKILNINITNSYFFVGNSLICTAKILTFFQQKITVYLIMQLA